MKIEVNIGAFRVDQRAGLNGDRRGRELDQSSNGLATRATLRAVVLTLALPILISSSAAGQIVEWPVTCGGNGHFYEAVEAPLGVTWTEAEALAAERGGYLATATSAGENTFIFGLIDDPVFWEQSGNNNLGPWLGGFQTLDNGDPSANWTWVTGEPWQYTNWAPGEPNNFFGAGEDYLAYACEGDGCRVDEWGDLPVDLRGTGGQIRGFVVEYEIVHGPLVEWPAASGGNGNFYQAVSRPWGVRWTEAFALSGAQGGYLATATSPEENSFIFDLIDDPIYWSQEPGASNLGPWLGGFQTSDNGDPNANWSWVSGEPWLFTHWANGEPNNFHGEGEDYLAYKCFGALDCRLDDWNDAVDDVSVFGTRIVAYVMEFDAAPSPLFIDGFESGNLCAWSTVASASSGR